MTHRLRCVVVAVLAALAAVERAVRAAYVDRYRPVYLAAVERLAGLLKQVGTAHDEFERISRTVGPLLPACAPTWTEFDARLDAWLTTARDVGAEV
jgi:hypothetical protein